MGPWDMVTTLALIFTATVTPFEVSFLEMSTSAREPLFIVNRIVDAVFVIDMLLNFFMMVEVRNESMSANSKWAVKPMSIACHYIQSWFLIDLLAVAPSAVDYIGLVDPSSASGDLTRLRVLRVLRVLRLGKLIRLIRASRILRRLLIRVPVRYGVLSLCKTIVTILILSHWLGCAWALQAYLQADLGSTWLVANEYCERDTNGEATSSSSNATTGATAYVCLAPHRLYAASVYWAVCTITSIGYGDIHPTAKNHVEQAFATGMMLCACVAWADTVATFCAVTGSFNPEQTAFQNTMDDLNRFMDREGFNPRLKRRLRAYFHATKHLRFAATQYRLLQDMPPSLQGEVMWNINHGWLRSVSFLRDASARFMVELSIHVHAVVFAPSDTAPRGYLYIVRRGIALYKGRVLTRSKIWGADVIIETESLRLKATARAMTFLEAFYLSRDELMALAKRHPQTAKVIRRAAIWLALRREIVSLARARQIEQGGGKAVASAAFSVLDTLSSASSNKKQRHWTESSDVPPMGGGSADHDAEPDADGTLKGSDDMGVRLEVLGAQIADARELTARRFAHIEQQQGSLMVMLRGMHSENVSAREAAQPPSSVERGERI